MAMSEGGDGDEQNQQIRIFRVGVQTKTNMEQKTGTGDRLIPALSSVHSAGTRVPVRTSAKRKLHKFATR